MSLSTMGENAHYDTDDPGFVNAWPTPANDRAPDHFTTVDGKDMAGPI